MFLLRLYCLGGLALDGGGVVPLGLGGRRRRGGGGHALLPATLGARASRGRHGDDCGKGLSGWIILESRDLETLVQDVCSVLLTVTQCK